MAHSERLDAVPDANGSQRLLEGCVAQFYDDDAEPPPLGLVIGLAAVALCDRLEALAVRLSYTWSETRAR